MESPKGMWLTLCLTKSMAKRVPRFLVLLLSPVLEACLHQLLTSPDQLLPPCMCPGLTMKSSRQFKMVLTAWPTMLSGSLSWKTPRTKLTPSTLLNCWAWSCAEPKETGKDGFLGESWAEQVGGIAIPQVTLQEMIPLLIALATCVFLFHLLNFHHTLVKKSGTDWLTIIISDLQRRTPGFEKG